MEELKESENIEINNLYNMISNEIERVKYNIAIQVSNEITLLYWNIGKDIKENILNLEKAEYGKEVIKRLSEKLTLKYGRGYSKANLFRMIKIYEYYPNYQIFSTLFFPVHVLILEFNLLISSTWTHANQ